MRLLTSIMLLIVSAMCTAAPVQVSGARIMELPDGSQLAFDISAPAKHSSFLLDNPPRLVVDLSGAQLNPIDKGKTLRTVDVRSVRTGIRAGADLRIVVDLYGLIRSETYTVRSAADGGYRLIIDVFRNDKPVPAMIRASTPPEKAPSVSSTQASVKVPRSKPKPREIVIAIDPGHGGKDPGAIGPRGTQEKWVVMQIARYLQKLVNKEKGMRAVLTRSTDEYLHLYDRIKIARQHNANLFISLHADAFPNPEAQGSSVFILSSGRASSVAAQLLADRENAVDRVGALRLVKADNVVNSVLIDMHQQATLEASLLLAENVLLQLRRVGKAHNTQVERAGFAVLTSPVIPSILVETAFITNPAEENKLRRSNYQKKIARAIMEGIIVFFRKRPPRQLITDAKPSESNLPVMGWGLRLVSTESLKQAADP